MVDAKARINEILERNIIAIYNDNSQNVTSYVMFHIFLKSDIYGFRVFLIEVNLFINKNTYIVRLWDALYALLILFSGEVYTCFGHFELVAGQTAMIMVRWTGLSGTYSMLFY